jgi:hypothetical protein
MAIRIGVDVLTISLPCGRRQSSVYKYNDILKLKQCDFDGWIDPQKWIPYPYDLLYLKTETKVKTGWWSGHHWEGLRLLPTDKVLYWKYKGETNERRNYGRP